MSRREYRVRQLTHGDESLSFEVDYRTNPNCHWLNVCTRDSLELAKLSIFTMKRGEVISTEVVHVE